MALTIDSSVASTNLQTQHLDAQQRSQLINGAAANYLGLSPQDLRSQLESGKSLSDIATAQGKSVDGLKSALLDALQGSASGGATIANPQALVNRIIGNKGDGNDDAGKIHNHHGHGHHGKHPLPVQAEGSDQTGTQVGTTGAAGSVNKLI